MTAAQIERAKSNLKRLRRRVFVHDEAMMWEDSEVEARDPHHIWAARRKIPLIEARLRAAGVSACPGF